MQRKRVEKSVAALAALVGWGGLALQLALLLGKLGFALGLWRFVGYFTTLTNLIAAIVASAVALGLTRGVGGQRARLATSTSIIMVGVTYSVALRGLWSPTGLQKVADVGLHDVTPVLWLLLWFNGQLRRTGWREIGWALLWPAVYALYALSRGAVDGWYAYWFLNPAEQSVGGLVLSIVIMICGFAMGAAVLIAINRRLCARPTLKRAESKRSPVDEAGIESFPASDPPSWTLGEEPRS